MKSSSSPELTLFNLSWLEVGKRLKNFVFAGLVLIVIFPLIGDYTNLFFPLGRDILFRIVIEVIFFAYLVLIILEKKYLPNLSLLLILLFLFLGANGLATVFSVQPKFSLWGNIFRGHGFFSQIHYFLFFVMLAGVVRSWKQWKKIILVAAFTSLPVSAIAFLEFLNARVAQSTLNNPNFLGAYLLLVLFMTSAMFFYYLGDKKKTDLRNFLALAAGLQFITIIFTTSRGAYFGLAVGLFLVVLLGLTKKISSLASLKTRRFWLFLGLVFLLLLIASPFYYLIRTHGPQLQNFLGPNPLPSEMSTGLIDWTRLEAYRTGVLALLNRPWFGFGPENFVVVYDRYFRGILPQMQYFDKAHNVFIEIAATTGFLGFFTYLGIWLVVFWLLVKKWQKGKEFSVFRAGLFVTFGAYLSQDFFNIDTTTSLIYIYLWWAFLNFLADPSTELNEGLAERISWSKTRTAMIVAAIMAPLVLFSIVQFNLKALEANLFRNWAEEELTKGNFESAFKWFEKGLEVGNPAVSPHLRFEYGKAAVNFAKIRRYLGKPLPEEILKRAIALQEENERNEWPYFTRNNLLAGEMANFLGFNDPQYLDRADRYLAKALEMSPRRWEAYLLGAKTDIARRDFSAAEKKIEEVLAVNYNYADAWFQYGLIKIYQGQSDKAKEYFLKAVRLSHVAYSFENRNEIALAYESVQDWESLVPVLEGLVRARPWTLEYRVRLIRAYSKTGRHDEVESQFRIVSAFAPPEYWSVIEELRKELE